MTVKRTVIAELDRAIVDIRNASQALERDDIQGALAAFESCSCRLSILAADLQSNAAIASPSESATAASTTGGYSNDGDTDD